MALKLREKSRHCLLEVKSRTPLKIASLRPPVGVNEPIESCHTGAGR